MSSIERFTTERLTAERPRPGDLSDLQRLHADPAFSSVFGLALSAEGVKEFLQETRDHWERHGFGLWTLRDRAEGVFVGRCGIRHVEIEGADEVELGYALLPEYWGKGLAIEASRVALSIAFGELGLDEVVAFTRPTNVRSRRVMEKLGFRYERDFMYKGMPHVLYRLRAPRSSRSADREGD
jgi:RimJ/RimL family protein N-acetyltransferase